MCYLTNEPDMKATPSLRNCHSTTENACCNWMHDDSIGGQFGDFIPGPCQGNYGELNLFMCMVCRGNSQKYVIKAEATKEYVDKITFLKREQNDFSTISNTFQDDIASGVA